MKATRTIRQQTEAAMHYRGPLAARATAALCPTTPSVTSVVPGPVFRADGLAVTPETVKAAIERVFGLSIMPSEYGNKHPLRVAARMVAIRCFREFTMLSYPEIARSMGKRAHSTHVMCDQRLGRILSRPIDHPTRVVWFGNGSRDIGDLLDAVRKDVLGVSA